MLRHWMRKLASEYDRALTQRPTLANFVTAGFLAFVGDASCQLLVEQQKYDSRRAFSMIAFSSCYQGAVCFHIYTHLYNCLVPESRWWGRTQLRSGLSKSLLDNFVHVPFLYIPTFYASVGILQGQDFREVGETLRSEMVSTVISCWVLWVPLQLLNFAVVPEQFRTMFVNVGCLVWNVYLSYQTKAARPVEMLESTAL
mmetsp:Transcript_38063/g.89083  ORF Transcript_38063/g.89083 Transcript_38063/m.89083 type:complete len:199 (-) Transcript_38063:264-860(-)